MSNRKPYNVQAVVSSFREVFEQGDIDKLTPTAHAWLKDQKAFSNHMIQDYEFCKRMYANAIGYLAYDISWLKTEKNHLRHPRFIEAFGKEYIESRLEIIKQICEIINELEGA